MDRSDLAMLYGTFVSLIALGLILVLFKGAPRKPAIGLIALSAMLIVGVHVLDRWMTSRLPRDAPPAHQVRFGKH